MPADPASYLEAAFLDAVTSTDFDPDILSELVTYKTASGHSMLTVALSAVFAACETKGLKLVRREAVVSQMPDAKLPMPVDTFCERMNSAADLWRSMFDRAPNFAAFELERPA